MMISTILSLLSNKWTITIKIFVFSEVKRKKEEPEPEPETIEPPEVTPLDEPSSIQDVPAPLKVPKWSVAVLNYCIFSCTVHFTVFETVAVPYSMHAYQWDTLHTSVGHRCYIMV